MLKSECYPRARGDETTRLAYMFVLFNGTPS